MRRLDIQCAPSQLKSRYERFLLPWERHSTVKRQSASSSRRFLLYGLVVTNPLTKPSSQRDEQKAVPDLRNEVPRLCSSIARNGNALREKPKGTTNAQVLLFN